MTAVHDVAGRVVANATPAGDHGVVDLLRIDDLAREAGITVRTVRSYVTRGLLPPPTRVVGRTNFYDKGHVARLRLIAELLSRSYTLESIAELIRAREAGQNLDEIIGLEVQVSERWFDETPIRLTGDELDGMFGHDDPVSRQRAQDGGYIVADGDGWLVPSPRLMEVGIAMLEAGVPLEAVLDMGDQLREQADRIADLFMSVVEDHVWEPFEEAGMPSDFMPIIAKFMERIRPMARAAVDAHVSQAVDRNTRLVARLAETAPPPVAEERPA